MARAAATRTCDGPRRRDTQCAAARARSVDYRVMIIAGMAITGSCVICRPDSTAIV
jgi:hypothetical protein